MRDVFEVAMQEFESVPQTKMSVEEAKKVMKVLADRQKVREEISGMPSVQDLAAMANAPVEEVYAALGQVRATPVVQRKPQLNPWVLPLIAICFLLLALLAIGSVAPQGPVSTEAPEATTMPPPLPSPTPPQPLPPSIPATPN